MRKKLFENIQAAQRKVQQAAQQLEQQRQQLQKAQKEFQDAQKAHMTAQKELSDAQQQQAQQQQNKMKADAQKTARQASQGGMQTGGQGLGMGSATAMGERMERKFLSPKKPHAVVVEMDNSNKKIYGTKVFESRTARDFWISNNRRYLTAVREMLEWKQQVKDAIPTVISLTKNHGYSVPKAIFEVSHNFFLDPKELTKALKEHLVEAGNEYPTGKNNTRKQAQDPAADMSDSGDLQTQRGKKIKGKDTDVKKK